MAAEGSETRGPNESGMGAEGLQRALVWIILWMASYPLLQIGQSNVKRITETPDYWADIKRSRVLFTDIRDNHGTGNTLFTEDEQHKIAAQLRGIRNSRTERFELSDEQLERITDKLDEAEEASRRMGRKDWLLLFSGTIFSVIITA